LFATRVPMALGFKFPIDKVILIRLLKSIKKVRTRNNNVVKPTVLMLAKKLTLR